MTFFLTGSNHRLADPSMAAPHASATSGVQSSSATSASVVRRTSPTTAAVRSAPNSACSFRAWGGLIVSSLRADLTTRAKADAEALLLALHVVREHVPHFGMFLEEARVEFVDQLGRARSGLREAALEGLHQVRVKLALERAAFACARRNGAHSFLSSVAVVSLTFADATQGVGPPRRRPGAGRHLRA